MSEELSLLQFFGRFPYYRAEGQTPGITSCEECGFAAWLVLNAEVKPPYAKVTMDCGGCGKCTTHDFTPSSL